MTGAPINRAVTGFAWLLSGTGIQAILQLIVTLALARLIAPREFGVIAAAMAIINLSTVITQIGVGPALVQKQELADVDVHTSWSLSLTFGLLVTLGMAAASPLIASFYGIPDLVWSLRLLSLAFVIQSFSTVPECLLQRRLEFRAIATVEVLAYALGYSLVALTLAFAGYGLIGLIAATLARGILRAVLLQLKLGMPIRFSINKGAAKQLLSFGGGFTLARIFNVVAMEADNIIIGRMLGVEALGAYNRAYQLLVLPANLFGKVLDRVLFPLMSRLQSDTPSLKQMYLAGLACIATIAMPIGAVSFALAPEMVALLLGDQWYSAVPPFQVLAVGIFFRSASKISDSLSRATGSVFARAGRQLVYAVLVSVGAYFGSAWGVTGAATGVLLAVVFNYVLMTHLGMVLVGIPLITMLRVHSGAFLLSLSAVLTASGVAYLGRGSQLSSFGIISIASILSGLTLVFIAIWLPRMVFDQNVLRLMARASVSSPFGLYLRSLISRFGEISR